MSSHDTTHEGGAHAHHITPISTLQKTFGLLMVLMVATILAANYMPEPLKGNTVIMNLIAMGIAVWKSWQVVAVFMGVRYAKKLTKILAIGGFLSFLLLWIALCDYGTRYTEPAPGWEAGVAPMALPRDGSRPEFER